MGLHNRIKLEFLSLPVNLRLARIAVTAFASEVDYNVNDIEEIKVAVSEAVSNAIIHGYLEKPDGVITITASLWSDALEIVVEDKGKGIDDLENALQPGSGDDPERMGLGFVFMRSFMDEVEVTTEPGQSTTVRLRKRLPGEVQAQWCAEK